MMDTTNSGQLTTSQFLPITVPICALLASLGWAVATYLMLREQYRAQVEVAAWKHEHHQHKHKHK
jgi:CHASE1-domain containing sensor protein